MAFVGGSGLSCLGRSGSSIRRGTGCSATTGGSCWGECGGVLRAGRRWDKDWEEGVGAAAILGWGFPGRAVVFFLVSDINISTFFHGFLCRYFVLLADSHHRYH